MMRLPRSSYRGTGKLEVSLLAVGLVVLAVGHLDLLQTWFPHALLAKVPHMVIDVG
jgi:hypothetical protein